MVRRIKEEDIIGLKFEKHTVLSFDRDRMREIKEKSHKSVTYVKCVCECGDERSVFYADLVRGKHIRCDCDIDDKVENFIGHKFNKLTILSLDKDKSENSKKKYVLCRCDCGNEKVLAFVDVKSKRGTKSCGCANGEYHGLSSHPMYSIWKKQRLRCNSDTSISYQYYGGRGIKCLWTVEEACQWYDKNPRPSLEYSLDRIDNDGHYEASNVRLADSSTQNINTRSNKRAIRIFEIDGGWRAHITINNKKHSKRSKIREEVESWLEEMLEYRDKLEEEKYKFKIIKKVVDK